MPDPIEILEDVPGGRRVVLRDSDLPYAKPRERAGFSSGGPVERELVYLPGREHPIVQVQQPRQRPIVYVGAFRDHLAIRDGRAAGPGHAKAMRDALEDIRRRCNPLWLRWGSEERRVFFAEADYGEEGPHDITYELTFDVLAAPGAMSFAPEAPAARGPADDVARLRAAGAARRAAVDRLAVARSVASALRTAHDLVDAALADLEPAIAALGAPGGLAAAALRVVGLARVARTATDALALLVRNTPRLEAVPAGGTDDVAAWWREQFGTATLCDELAAQLRAIAADARARVRSASRLYTVRPGDTLESIAREQLGSAARARELGVRPEDLAPGRVLAIPAAN